MSRTIVGPLLLPDGSPLAGATIKVLAAQLNWSADGLIPQAVEYSFVTDAQGQFQETLANGMFDVYHVLDTGAMDKMGTVVVEDGVTLTLGELITQSADQNFPSVSHWATQNWVLNILTIGADPYNVDVSALNPGDGQPGQLLRVTADGLYLEYVAPKLTDWLVGLPVAKARLTRGTDGKVASLPVAKVVTANVVAVAGDRLLVDMDGAGGDLTVTLPDAAEVADEPVSIVVISATFILPYTLTIARPAGDTIMGENDNLAITRRRSIALHHVGGNDWRFT